jgi:hypothetical protein
MDLVINMFVRQKYILIASIEHKVTLIGAVSGSGHELTAFIHSVKSKQSITHED